MADQPLTPIDIPTQALTAGTDNVITLARRATAGINVQNNTGAQLCVGRDQVATANGPIVLRDHESYATDLPVSVLHLYPAATATLNGTGAINVYVEAGQL
jgi:hypothetical protein